MNKISKTQIQKIEKEKRKEFVNGTADAIVQEIMDKLKDCRNQINITIKTGQGGYNRYINVRRAKNGLGIIVYNKGNVEVTLKEAVYEDLTFTMVLYEKIKDTDETISIVKQAAAVLLDVVINGGMRTLMYYMNGCRHGSNWRDCLDEYRASVVTNDNPIEK